MCWEGFHPKLELCSLAVDLQVDTGKDKARAQQVRLLHQLDIVTALYSKYTHFTRTHATYTFGQVKPALSRFQYEPSRAPSIEHDAAPLVKLPAGNADANIDVLQCTCRPLASSALNPRVSSLEPQTCAKTCIALNASAVSLQFKPILAEPVQFVPSFHCTCPT